MGVDLAPVSGSERNVLPVVVLAEVEPRVVVRVHVRAREGERSAARLLGGGVALELAEGLGGLV